MSFEIRVDASPVYQFLDRFRRREGTKAGLLAAGQHVRRVLQVYPAESHRPQPFVSDRQRRGFFALLKAGFIKVPYPRSGKLGRSWLLVVSDGGLRVTVGTHYRNAQFVVGKKQSRYHKVTGWRRAEDVVKNEKATLQKLVAAGVRRDL